jgi:hypothetical protein
MRQHWRQSRDRSTARTACLLCSSSRWQPASGAAQRVSKQGDPAGPAPCCCLQGEAVAADSTGSSAAERIQRFRTADQAV